MKSDKKVGRRRGAEGDARGDIIRAAKECFAQKGYDRATMREIGLLADVDPSLIVHYFGSKEHLFTEVFILDLPDMQLAERLANVPREQWGATLADLFVTIAESSEWFSLMVGMVRSAATEPKVADMLAHLFRNAIIDKFSLLDISHAPQRAAMLASFMLGITFTGHIVGINDFVKASPELRRALFADFIQPILTASIDEV